ncbi:MAG: gamma-glutamylcyclotransferase [Polyangiaceae bacterium]|nr:gamma-glutamylcyclotransferase [Polyangiaceae bacterium]
MRLFVYGTLLRGEANHAIVARARFIAEAHTAPMFELLDLGEYPGLVAGGARSIAGEVYEIDPEDIAVVDEFEGHPDLFRREMIALSDGSSAFSYVLARRPAKSVVIVGDSWRTR